MAAGHDREDARLNQHEREEIAMNYREAAEHAERVLQESQSSGQIKYDKVTVRGDEEQGFHIFGRVVSDHTRVERLPDPRLTRRTTDQ
jgi:hypothetical protein